MVWDGLVKNNLTIGCLRTIIPIHITDIWKPMGNPVLRCLIMAFFWFLKSALCKWSISNFFTPINRLNKADKNWESIVAQSTENIGNHIVKNSRTRANKNHKHVAVGIFWYIIGDSHKCYEAMWKQSAYQCKYNCKKYTQNNWNGNTFSHSTFIFCTESLTETYPESTGKTVYKAEYKINYNACGADCGKCVGAKRFSYNNGVSKPNRFYPYQKPYIRSP